MTSKCAKMVSAKSASIALCVVFIACSAPGCGRGIEIGPVEFEFQALSNLPLPATALSNLPAEGYTETFEFPDLPSEVDLQQYVQQAAGGFDVTRFVQLSRIQLASVAINASAGDFRTVEQISLYYVPADSGDELLLGTASAPNGGFGQQIVLSTDEPVNFLEIIRDNDETEGGDPPQLRLAIQVNSETPVDITYSANVTLQVYARVGLLG